VTATNLATFTVHSTLILNFEISSGCKEEYDANKRNTSEYMMTRERIHYFNNMITPGHRITSDIL
jgi:hypothetical protein